MKNSTNLHSFTLSSNNKANREVLEVIHLEASDMEEPTLVWWEDMEGIQDMGMEEFLLMDWEALEANNNCYSKMDSEVSVLEVLESVDGKSCSSPVDDNLEFEDELSLDLCFFYLTYEIRLDF